MVDYSLYLVTDNTKPILGDRDIVQVVRDAVEGGVTVVQLRDKTSETSELIRIATELHKVTKQHGVPLIINDRADVAIAVGAEGLHIGQDDMDLASARKIMGPDAIIGVSAQSIEDATLAAKAGADYLGIGTIYATSTKKNTRSIIGPSGLRAILAALGAESLDLPTVCIGSINASNLQRVLYQTATPEKQCSGVAVVSAIMAAPDPKAAASKLQNLLRTPPPFASVATSTKPAEPQSLIANIPAILRRVASTKPINHHMTNFVVQNFAANVALAVGSSPIMSTNREEAADLAALGGSLVINIGTMAPDSVANYLAGVRAYNAQGGPVLLDPVGGGATTARREVVRTLLNEGYFDVIKGNESEIQTLLGESEVKQRGVDSAPGSVLSHEDKARIVKSLAARERNVVIKTGETDYLSDGERVLAVSNGHHYLGNITGSGCTLGTTIAACLAVERVDKLNATLAGLLLYEIAAERAARSDFVRGPGTFVPALIDELFGIRSNIDDASWLRDAKVDTVQV